MSREMDIVASNKIPSVEEISAASNMTVFDSKGFKLTFGSLHAERRMAIVFIRHFICGMCHNYVAQISGIPKENLQAAKTELVIVGCGDWKMIETYKRSTGFEGCIYADPSRTLYRHFGMTEHIEGGKDDSKPSYVKGNLSTTLGSIMRAMKDPLNWGRWGNISQNGGEFIFGPGNTCSLAHRMRHSQDHMDVEELKKELIKTKSSS